MNTGQTVFSQLLDFLPLHEFRKCVNRYNGNYKIRTFTCLDHFLTLSFAQFTYRESLRDIETCLRSLSSKLYHSGIRGKISRSTLADANELRDWRIYSDFAMVLIKEARQLYCTEAFGAELDNMVYALDATIIDLCLTLFPWAQFRKHKSAVKIHTLLDLRGNIPALIWITSGAVHEINILDTLPIEPGAIYLIDRGYFDYARLHRIHASQAYFITRAKCNTKLKRIYSNPVNKTTGVMCDQIVVPIIFYSEKEYPDKLRRIKYYDKETNKRLIFLTNNFLLPAITIAQLFKCRWQIELFFKWLKQHLRIKAFYGTSENAVKVQIWIAIAAYVLVAIVKKRLKIKESLYQMLQIISVTLFEKQPLLQVLTDFKEQELDDDNAIQLNLFN
jgi:hypothetical protein